MALIYIVEDDKNIREIEIFALKNSGYEVEAFDCAKDFYKKMQKKLPHLILLDIMLPDEDGLTILKRLKGIRETSKIPVILITAKTMETDKVEGLEQGADDYITKPFGVMELVARVKALLRRCDIASDVKEYTLDEIKLFTDRRIVTVSEKEIELTYKEYELLRLLLEKKRTVVSRECILERVWDTAFEGASRTLDMHIRTLRKKLEESGGRIKTIRNVGYIIE